MGARAPSTGPVVVAVVSIAVAVVFAWSQWGATAPPIVATPPAAESEPAAVESAVSTEPDPHAATPAAATPSAAAPAPDSTRVEVDAEPQPHPDLAALRGRVVGADGTPLEGVAITADVTLFPILRRRFRASSSADGAFRFDDLVPGRVSLQLDSDRHCQVQSRAFELKAGHTFDTGDLVMHEGATIDGQIRVDGQLAAGVQLWILPAADGELRAQGIAIVSGRDGTFTARERLPPGRYRVLVMPAFLGTLTPPRGAKLVVDDFDIVAGQTGHTVRVELESRRR